MRVNRDAIGSWVEVRQGERVIRRQVMPTRSYLSQVELPVTIGSGPETQDRCPNDAALGVGGRRLWGRRTLVFLPASAVALGVAFVGLSARVAAFPGLRRTLLVASALGAPLGGASALPAACGRLGIGRAGRLTA